MDDLWIVTCYFNSGGFRTKRRNFDRFIEPLEAARLPWLAVECAFGTQPFDLPPSDRVIQVRAEAVLWQKERLLNLAISRLPKECRKVAWIDGDVLFQNERWAVETSALLENHPVVQPFDRVIRLPKGHEDFRGEGECWPSFGTVYHGDQAALRTGDFDLHGHTGFAWAARREALPEEGLYDACIAGSGDHMMAHAFCGDWESACIRRIIGKGNPHDGYFSRWARRAYERTHGRVGFTPGALLHLWHGEMKHRRYVHRNRELEQFGFDPALDLKIGESGCWEWNRPRPLLQQWAIRYFHDRQEDGEQAPLAQAGSWAEYWAAARR